MQVIKNLFSDLHGRLEQINLLITPDLPTVTFYRTVTVPVKFNNASQNFDHIVSWSYSLIFESLSKNYDFLFKHAQRVEKSLSLDSVEIKQTIHYLRTYGQHSQFDEMRLDEFIEYRETWFQKVCGQGEPTSDEEWMTCTQNILKSIIEVINCFEETIKDALNSEFKEVFIQGWSRLATRTFAKYEYDNVLLKVLADHGLEKKIDHQLFTKRYLNDWQRGIEILPDGFNFEKEVYSIIQRSIAKEDIIPIEADELMAAGIPSGPSLGRCIAEAKRSFYANPCTPADLLERVVVWHNLQESQ